MLFFLYCFISLYLPGDFSIQVIVAGIQEVVRRPACEVGALTILLHGRQHIRTIPLRYKGKNVVDGAVVHPQHICCQFYFRGLGPADGNKDVVAQVVGWLGQLRKASIVQYQVVVLALASRMQVRSL